MRTNINSRTVWKSEQWRALAAMLGIPVDERGITSCAIVLDCEKNAEVFVDLTRLPADVVEKLKAQDARRAARQSQRGKHGPPATGPSGT